MFRVCTVGPLDADGPGCRGVGRDGAVDHTAGHRRAGQRTVQGELVHIETAARGAKKPKNVANWILNDLQSALGAASLAITDCPVPPHALDELVNLIDSGSINSKQGKEVFAEMFGTGKAATVLVEEKGLKQESDTGAIEAFVDQVIAANPGPVADFKAGKVSALNFLKGQVMKLSKGKANPALAGEILEKKLQ